MKIIRPAPITAAELVASSVADTPAAWAVGTTYALDDRVQDPATHREYESQQANNLGHALSDPAWWVDIGATNRWRMFDQSNTSQTMVAEELIVDLKIPGRVDSVALLNCQAGTARITGKVNGLQVYDATFRLTSSSGIETWYAYFFEPIERRPDLIVTDLPLFSNMDLRIQISRPGGMVRVGTLVVGQSKDLGITLTGLTAGIIDYSRKVTNDFGDAMLVERAFAKKLDARIVIDNAEVEQVFLKLAQLRATPVVWVADDRWAHAALYGFYRNFSTTFEFEQKSTCLLELEGLT